MTASSSKSCHWPTSTYHHHRWKIIGIQLMTAVTIAIIHHIARQRQDTFGPAGQRTVQHYRRHHQCRACRSREPPNRRRHHSLVTLAICHLVTQRRLRSSPGNPWFMPTNPRNDKNLSIFFNHNHNTYWGYNLVKLVSCNMQIYICIFFLRGGGL